MDPFVFVFHQLINQKAEQGSKCSIAHYSKIGEAELLLTVEKEEEKIHARQ